MGLSSKAASRALDLGVSLAGLMLLAPVLPFIAAAIKLESRGPVFHRDLRVGQQRRELDRTTGGRRLHDARGHLFRCLRFRVLGSELFTIGRRRGEHPQLTRVGRFLRRTGLEDWPQLWLVLRGSMSLIGPRPLTPQCVDRLCREFPAYGGRLTELKPGLLGFAQSGCAEAPNFFAAVCEKIVFDLHYRERLAETSPSRVVWSDLKMAAASLAERWRSCRRAVGTAVIRVEYPLSFSQSECQPAALARRLPADLSGEVVEHEGGLTCWWYPPHRPLLRLSVPEDELLAEVCESITVESGGALCFTKALRATGAEGLDIIQAELPSALEDVQAVAEHLLDLWQALAVRSSDEHFVYRMSFLLIEGLVTMAGSAPAGHGRLQVAVEIGRERVLLRLSSVAGERVGALLPASSRVLASATS